MTPRGHPTPVPGADNLAIMRVLAGLPSLNADEITLIQRMAPFGEIIPAGSALVSNGKTGAPRLILRGWACRQRTLPDGRRQIFGFLLPGDGMGLSADSRAVDDEATVALTRIECIDACVLHEILAMGDARHDGLRSALAEQRWREDAWLLDHLVRLGRESASERTAHLILELRDRLERAGLCNGASFAFPLTQEVLADSLGLSLVHISRILGQMKHDGLIALNGGWLTILDENRLRNAGGMGLPRTSPRKLRMESSR